MSLMLLLGVLGFVLQRNYRARSGGHPIASSGGRPLSVHLPWGGAHYMQDDARWGDAKLGGGADTLGSAGCTVCSIAMAVTSLGEKVTPLELNERLTKNQGFTNEGWLIWGAIAKALDGKVEAVVTDRPSHADLDNALERGEFPIVKFILVSGIPHWVVIVGKEGMDYLVHDPLAHSERALTLSSRTDHIYSARFIRKKV